MKNWKKRLDYYGLSKSVIIILFFVSILSVIAEFISIGMFIPLFDLVSQSQTTGLDVSNSKIAIYLHKFAQLFNIELTIELILLLSFALFTFSKALVFLISYIQSYYNGLIAKKMRDKLFDMYLRVSSSYYDDTSIGDFINSISVELPAAVGGVLLPIKLIITIFSAIGSFIFLLIISPQLTFVSLFVILLVILFPYRWVKASTKAGKKNSRNNSAISSFLIDKLHSPRLVRISNTEKEEKCIHNILTEKRRKSTLIVQVLKARVTFVLEPMVIGVSMLMFYFSFMILKMSISSMLLYMVVMVRMVPIVSNILTQNQGINRTKGPINSVENLINKMSESINSRKENTFNEMPNKITIVDKISLKDACFRFNKSKNSSLTNINYTFNKSSITVIVGPSGSGKTTFVDIVSGYRSLTSGSIFVNDIDVSANSKELMSIVSYVPQFTQIFDNTTIYDHIVYGIKNSNKDDIINASKLSGAYDFIKKLPYGFDTILTGASSNLSGGQKQLLDLSRALLADAPVIILDEPTGNLDLISERKLMSNINKIRETTDKIIIIIAHRLHAIINIENIIVMDNGKISGSGTHSELLNNNTWYKQAVTELQQ